MLQALERALIGMVVAHVHAHGARHHQQAGAAENLDDPQGLRDVLNAFADTILIDGCQGRAPDGLPAHEAVNLDRLFRVVAQPLEVVIRSVYGYGTVKCQTGLDTFKPCRLRHAHRIDQGHITSETVAADRFLHVSYPPFACVGLAQIGSQLLLWGTCVTDRLPRLHYSIPELSIQT